MKQFLITPAAGKRLISKAVLKHPSIQNTLNEGTLVIVAGTTNGYVAEEILCEINQQHDFSRKRFFRGISLPENLPRTIQGRILNENDFPGDVVINDGVWQKKVTIFEVADQLNEGDVIIKGANALNLSSNQAGVYIGNPQGGTILAALKAHVGRRVELILPVGLEKRIPGDINEIARKLNQADSKGPRMLPVPGKVITEIEAIKILTGAKAVVVAAGGVSGAEGSVYIAIGGTDDQIKEAEELLNRLASEELFRL